MSPSLCPAEPGWRVKAWTGRRAAHSLLSRAAPVQYNCCIYVDVHPTSLFAMLLACLPAHRSFPALGVSILLLPFVFLGQPTTDPFPSFVCMRVACVKDTAFPLSSSAYLSTLSVRSTRGFSDKQVLLLLSIGFLRF